MPRTLFNSSSLCGICLSTREAYERNIREYSPTQQIQRNSLNAINTDIEWKRLLRLIMADAGVRTDLENKSCALKQAT